MTSQPGIGAKLLFNQTGAIRCAWRVLTFYFVAVLVVVLLGGFSTTLLRLAGSGGFLRQPLFGALLNSTLLLVAVVIASAFCAAVLERRSLGSTGFQRHPGWLRDLSLGAVLGFAALCLAVVVPWLLGSVSFATPTAAWPRILGNLFLLFFFFLIAAAGEELLFRGFAYQALIQGAGPGPAIALSSLAFGLLHLANPDGTVVSTTNTVLAGLWLGVAYLVTRSLWLALGLHFAWNLATVFLFGLPVSGIKDFESLAWYDGQALSREWLTGGTYGPEGGAAATGAIVLCTLIVWKSGWFRTTPAMMASIRYGSAVRSDLSTSPLNLQPEDATVRPEVTDEPGTDG